MHQLEILTKLLDLAIHSKGIKIKLKVIRIKSKVTIMHYKEIGIKLWDNLTILLVLKIMYQVLQIVFQDLLIMLQEVKILFKDPKIMLKDLLINYLENKITLMVVEIESMETIIQSLVAQKDLISGDFDYSHIFIIPF